jgi:putative transposase
MFDWVVAGVQRTDAHRCKVLPRRWIVDRTFAWLNYFRRLTKAHDVLPHSSDILTSIMIYLALR